mmetsp:Transcript_108824/g.307820  ORF Transcript_108824/g.307820 Transcript_108824/m.307820 type:complete len:781 (-) Transcript_108824:144-2486(-)
MSSSPVSLSTTMATSSQPVIHLMPGPPRTLRRFSPHWTTSIMLGLPRPPVALIPWNFSQPHSRLQRATFVRSSQKPPTTKELLYLPYGSAKRVGSGGGFFAAASLAAASLAAASLFAAACLAAAAAAASAWGFPAGCDGPGGGALAASSFFRSASAASSGTPALRSACTISCFSLQPRMLTSKFFARSFSLATGSSSSFGAGGASGGVPSVVEWRLHLFLTTGTTSMGLRSCVFSNFVLWLSSSHTAQRNASQLRHWTTARSAGTFSQPSHLLRFGFGAGFGAGAAGFTVGGISFFAILDGCEVPTSAGRFTPAVLGGLLPLAAGFGALAPVLLSPAAPLLPPLVPVEGAAVPPAGFPLASSLVARPHRWRQRAVWTKRRSTGPTGLSGAASFLAESPSFFSASPSFFSASPSFFSPSPSFLSASFFASSGFSLSVFSAFSASSMTIFSLTGFPTARPLSLKAFENSSHQSSSEPLKPTSSASFISSCVLKAPVSSSVSSNIFTTGGGGGSLPARISASSPSVKKQPVSDLSSRSVMTTASGMPEVGEQPRSRQIAPSSSSQSSSSPSKPTWRAMTNISSFLRYLSSSLSQRVKTCFLSVSRSTGSSSSSSSTSAISLSWACLMASTSSLSDKKQPPSDSSSRSFMKAASVIPSAGAQPCSEQSSSYISGHSSSSPSKPEQVASFSSSSGFSAPSPSLSHSANTRCFKSPRLRVSSLALDSRLRFLGWAGSSAGAESSCDGAGAAAFGGAGLGLGSSLGTSFGTPPARSAATSSSFSAQP